jgi:hypothetical protein
MRLGSGVLYWLLRRGHAATLSDRCSTCGIGYGKLRGMATIEELFESAVDARRVAQNAIRLAVREARGASWSWDRISAALGGTPNGETLRRNFGDQDP